MVSIFFMIFFLIFSSKPFRKFLGNQRKEQIDKINFCDKKFHKNIPYSGAGNFPKFPTLSIHIYGNATHIYLFNNFRIIDVYYININECLVRHTVCAVNYQSHANELRYHHSTHCKCAFA